MKSIICLALLFVAVACVLACDRDSDNQPECNTRNLNVAVRNFWDPTHYWECKSAGGAAESVACAIGTGFDPVTGDCIEWSQWKWVDPCPAKN